MLQTDRSPNRFHRSSRHHHKRLTDPYGRTIDYLRLAVTDRCNLRCRYCMPVEGISFVPHSQILRMEEMERLVRIFAFLGVKKIRITGGEPFIRRGLTALIGRISQIRGIESVHVTTNGVATARHLPELKEAGLSGINLSLDSLDRERFWSITRRDVLNKVLLTLEQTLKIGLPLKINTVMLNGFNRDDMKPLSELASLLPVTVRFIELMPFTGNKEKQPPSWTKARILTALKNLYPEIVPVENSVSSTASLYQVPGFAGKIGIIGGYSREFCARCNKIRITPQGTLQTCLYSKGGLDLRELLRNGASDSELVTAIVQAVAAKPENGYRAALKNTGPAASMAAIGG